MISQYSIADAQHHAEDIVSSKTHIFDVFKKSSEDCLSAFPNARGTRAVMQYEVFSFKTGRHNALAQASVQFHTGELLQLVLGWISDIDNDHYIVIQAVGEMVFYIVNSDVLHQENMDDDFRAKMKSFLAPIGMALKNLYLAVNQTPFHCIGARIVGDSYTDGSFDMHYASATINGGVNILTHQFAIIDIANKIILSDIFRNFSMSHAEERAEPGLISIENIDCHHRCDESGFMLSQMSLRGLNHTFFTYSFHEAFAYYLYMTGKLKGSYSLSSLDIDFQDIRDQLHSHYNVAMSKSGILQDHITVSFVTGDF